jgi:hypothetical protein
MRYRFGFSNVQFTGSCVHLLSILIPMPVSSDSPLFGSWPRAYAVVIGALLLEIAFFYGLMRWFA